MFNVKMPESIRRKIKPTHEEKIEDLDHELEIESRKAKIRKAKSKGVKGKKKSDKYQPNQRGLDMMYGGGV